MQVCKLNVFVFILINVIFSGFQVVRLRSCGDRIVGTIVPDSCVNPIIQMLTTESENFTEASF